MSTIADLTLGDVGKIVRIDTDRTTITGRLNEMRVGLDTDTVRSMTATVREMTTQRISLTVGPWRWDDIDITTRAEVWIVE